MTTAGRHAYAEALRRAGQLADALRAPDLHDPSEPVTAGPRPRSLFEETWSPAGPESDPFEMQETSADHVARPPWTEDVPAPTPSRPPGAVPADGGDVPPGRAATRPRPDGLYPSPAQAAAAAAPVTNAPAADPSVPQHPPSLRGTDTSVTVVAAAPPTPGPASPTDRNGPRVEAAHGGTPPSNPRPNAGSGDDQADEDTRTARSRAAAAPADVPAFDVVTALPLSASAMPHTPSAAATSAPPSAANVIEIEIGRVEVRLVAEAPVKSVTPPRPARASTGPTLDEYLAGRHDAAGRWRT